MACPDTGEKLSDSFLSCSALSLLISLNVLDGTLFPTLSQQDRAAEIDKGKVSN
jgi:hypothetical protein